MSSLQKLLREIHKRTVWQVLVTYIGISWLVLEIAEHVIGQWGIPEQAYPIALLLLLVGLPFVVATAWLQPEPWQKGRAEPEPDEDAPTRPPSQLGIAARRIFTWKNSVLGGLSVLIVWSTLYLGSALRAGVGRTGSPATFASVWPSVDRSYSASLFVKMLRCTSPIPACRHLAEGITDELIHALNHLEGLRVLSFTTSMSLEETSLRAPEIGELLSVDHLLEGSITVVGDSVRAIIQLIATAKDEHEWSLAFPGSLGGEFELRERIASTVTDSAKAHLPIGGALHEVERFAESPAHEAHLHGKQALGRRTPEGIREAMRSFQKAIDLDPGYAPAYGGLSSAYALSITYRTALPMNAYSAAGLSVRLATRAIELAPGLAAGYAARGYVSAASFAPTSIVMADFDRALNLEPNAPEVPGWYAVLLRREGRGDEALAASRRSAELSPLEPGRRVGLALEALRSRDYDLAAREARQASRLQPGIMLPLAIEARALLLSNRAEECVELDLGPYVATRALCLIAAGREAEGRALATDLRREVEAGVYSHPDYTVVLPTEDLTVYYAWNGQADLCLEWLERTFSLSPRGIDDPTLESGLFDPVIDEPGFRDELQRLRERVWSRVERMADSDELLPTIGPTP